jgi:hypothetical protein
MPKAEMTGVVAATAEVIGEVTAEVTAEVIEEVTADEEAWFILPTIFFSILIYLLWTTACCVRRVANTF